MIYRGQYGDHATAVTINHIGEDEIGELTELLAAMLRSCGLNGEALDAALAGALAAILPVLEHQRELAATCGTVH